VSLSDILAAVFSAFAAGTALLTFVYTFALKPSLRIQIGQEIALHYTTNHPGVAEDRRMRLILTADFVFLNKGAQPMAMAELFGTLWPSGSPQPSAPNLVWRRYEKTKRVSPLGAPADYRTGSAGMVQTTIVPGRDVSAAKIRLYSLRSNVMSDGLHILNLRAVDGSARGKGAALTCLLHLNESDANDLTENGAEVGGKFGMRISLKRTVAAKELSRENRRSRGPAARQRWGGSRVVYFESDGRWGVS